MENNTSILEFQVLPFFMNTEAALVYCIVFFFFIYFFGITVNLFIIILICVTPHLHTPMYLFLCNLSFIDLCYITVIVPKLLYISLSGNSQISFTQCFIQMYSLFTTGCAENTVIFIMAYDRYVAICHPLHYHHILSKKTCILLMVVNWILACSNSSLFTSSILKMSFCSSLTVHQLFCDTKALAKISCGGTHMFYKVVFADLLIYALFPVVCNVMSYLRILMVILGIKSKDGRRKAFSTCSSHLIVMVIYYGSASSIYILPASESYNVVEQILTVFFTTVIPVLNPLIYSLRNSEIKSSFIKLLS
ncbi:olfactory receptor 2L3-like [Gastrophryne carolinensis]